MSRPDVPLLFLSYAREDNKWVEQLRPYLLFRQRLKEFDIFYDRQILPGFKWDDRIRGELARADIVLAVLSINMLNSDYAMGVELKEAQKRGAHIVPVIAQKCDWESVLGQLAALPIDKKGEIRPLDQWRNRPDVMSYVAGEVGRIAKGVRRGELGPAVARRAATRRRRAVSLRAAPSVPAQAPAMGTPPTERADELLELALESGSSLFELCQTRAFWVRQLRQHITMTVRIDADWSVRYEKSIDMRVRGTGAIVAAPFRIRARAEAMSRLGVFDVDARYQEPGAANQPLLFPAASGAGKGMEERAYAVIFTPPVTAAGRRRFLLWFAVAKEFAQTLGSRRDRKPDVLSCLTLQLAHAHVVDLRFEVLVSRKLPPLKLQPQFDCRVARPIAGVAHVRHIFTAPPGRVTGELRQWIKVAVDSRPGRVV